MQKPMLNDVSTAFAPGKLCLVLGPPKSGKTTLLKYAPELLAFLPLNKKAFKTMLSIELVKSTGQSHNDWNRAFKRRPMVNSSSMALKFPGAWRQGLQRMFLKLTSILPG